MTMSTQDSDDIIAGINVTPLVDIVLVILIIFIMTASVIFRNEIPVDLPKAASGEPSVSSLLNVGLASDGQLFLNGRPGRLEELPGVIRKMRAKASAGAPPLKAFVSADVRTQYGAFATVVDRLRLEGVTDIALDTQPASEPEPEARR